MKYIYLFNLFCISLILSCQPKAESDYIDTISINEFSQQMNSPEVQLIDVRTEKEYAQGHVADAMNIDVMKTEDFKNEIKSLDTSKTVMVYCKSGKRSSKAAQILEEQGFTDIKNLDGGYKDLAE